MKPHIYYINILEKHLDAFQHVNNAVYLELYEEARWDQLTQGGITLESILASKIGPVITDINIIYKKELRNRETIRIETQYTHMKNRLIANIEQRIFNANNELASIMNMSLGILDLENRKLLSFTQNWKNALGITD